jgi:hypothetical protein
MFRSSFLAIAMLFGMLGCNSSNPSPDPDAGAHHEADGGHDGAVPGSLCECPCTPTHVRFEKPALEDCWEISCDPYCGAPGFGNACGVN